MKKVIFILFLSIFLYKIDAQVVPFITPNSGMEYTFEDLVTHSSGTVIKEGDVYVMQDDVTISALDALIVSEDITVKIFTGKILTIDGARLEIDAPEQAIFTNYTEGEYYATIRIEEGSYARLNNATFTYGSGMRVIESDFVMDNCTMNNNNYSSQAAGAVSGTRGKIIVKNSTFKNNVRSAFSSGTNMGCTFEISNCYLENNVTENSNRPQINIGPSQSGETTKIMDNTVIGNRLSLQVGGIGTTSLLGVSTSFWIEGNTVIDNRYGITFTGSNIVGTIKGNILKDNNTQNNPNLGGSGINITASGGNTHAIITENTISGHLWGITLVGNTTSFVTGPTANIGNISVPENDPEYNIGKNIFFNNGNNGELFDLYNNNPNDVMAQNNNWGVSEQTEDLIRTVVRDKTNDSRYGTITFMPPYNICYPVTDLKAVYNSDCEAVLTWSAPVGKLFNIFRDGVSVASALTATSYTDTGFKIYEGHTWTVTAVCGDLDADPVSVTLGACIKPYITPNTELEYTFEDLVTHSSGTVIKEADIYLMRNDVTISPLDALIITDDITVKIFPGKVLTINESRWEIDAPEQTIFTNYIEGEYYASIRVEENSYVRLKNATFTFGGGIRVFGSDFVMDNCTMNNNNTTSSTTGVISATRGKVIVKNSTFKDNVQSAFSSGANIGCTFEITDCYLENNVTANSNTPQINVGPGQTNETTKIIGNTIIGNRDYTMVGGIGASSLYSLVTSFWVEDNTVIDNRYGITFTGANITGTIKGNTLTDNNVEVNPMNGGSGINITGTAGNVHAVISENIISGHHWGITLLGNYLTYTVGPTANIGNISVPEDDPEYNIGKNIFFNNGNNGELIDLYNNNPNDVMAQNNNWGVSEQTEELIRTVVRDKTNDSRYGIVTFMPPYIIYDNCNPVADLAVVYNNDCKAVISWTAPSLSRNITYTIFRDNELVISKLTATSYTDAGFDIYTDHTWTVTVSCGEDLESEPVAVTKGACAYIITATAGNNGRITPDGAVTVKNGDSQIFEILPDDGYFISQVLVDGVNNIEAVTNGEFTFSAISNNHTIHASFESKLFPAPRSFKMSYIYIYIGESGICGGEYVGGATYCTKFVWEAPDLSETEAQLVSYNIYYYHTNHDFEYEEGMEIPYSEGELIAQTVNTQLEMEIGIMGITWVTAVYYDPEGESNPSNTQFNGELPISIDNIATHPYQIFYNKHQNGIEIKGINNIKSLDIICLDGRAMSSITAFSSSDNHFVDMSGIRKGVYIVKILTTDSKIITEKVVILEDK